MKPTRLWATAAAVTLLLATPADAHRRWLLPSATVLSSTEAWVTVDAASSNDLFYFEHRPIPLDGLAIMAPDGTEVPAENSSTGQYRSSFDVRLAQSGTYKVAVVGDMVLAQYEENGEPKRWRGAAEAFAREVPADAPELRATHGSSRMETFVTVGGPTETVLAPTGKGLELVPITHPNDLFAGEEARFRLTMDGEPAPDVDVSIVPGGIRYRDNLNEMKVTTDAEGGFAVTWPAPGMYWLNAAMQGEKSGIPRVDRRRVGYTATLEVLPQ